MHGETAAWVPRVILGGDPFWVSLAIFTFTYAIIITERLNRSIIALIGACLMIFGGVLNQQAALRGVDFNTLGLLTGMMVIVAITRKCGVFQYVAIWSAKLVHASPWGILVMLSLMTALFSALLDNVTTVLLVAPVTLLITEELNIKPYPFLFAEIFASNIGGTATLIGDPPNIMIGSAANLSFNQFLLHLAPITPLILALTMALIYVIWGRAMHAETAARERVMRFDERETITDVRLLKQSMSVLSLVVLGFVLAHPLHLEPATVAMAGAALLLLLDNFPRHAEAQSEHVHKTFGEVEWVTIFFFLGLFIVVHGIETAGVLTWLANKVVALTGGNLAVTAQAILWVSAVASAIVDNIPFVATMIPLIKSMAPVFGGTEQLMPLWWALALGACLGGNGSLIGASANLIVAGISERAGHPIRFLAFTMLAFPLMLMSIGVSSVYIYLRYL
jgi:Na+/H+ antiporter NhaD/arsenite permease-like protein